MKKKVIGFCVLSVLLAFLIIFVGPFDGFRHGHYYEEYYFKHIEPQDWQDQISLESDYYEMQFKPVKKYFNGFSIYIGNQQEDNNGTLTMTIFDKGKQIDSMQVALKDVVGGQWYKVNTHKYLKKDKEYTLRFESANSPIPPVLQNVLPDYLPDETVTGNILLAYGYAKSTFNLQERTLIVLALIGAWILFAGMLLECKYSKASKLSGVICLLTVMLAWNYMNNSMNINNDEFSEYQMDSETLVSSMIFAEHDDVYFSDPAEYGYGLGRYYDLKAEHNDYTSDFPTDDVWVDGFSRTAGDIMVDSNIYTQAVIAIGNYIEFSNGDRFEIAGFSDDHKHIFISLGRKEPLMELKYGSLAEARIYDKDGNLLPKGYLECYISQYGLQGKIFRHLARLMDYDEAIANLNLICCILTAFVFVLLTLLLAQKYNKIMAGCFFATFFLAPFVINYARNLYWLEFSWFIPILIGLFCSWKINDFKYRVLSYIATFVAITFKCLCGYEYITSVMLGLISFLLVDLVVEIFNRNKEQSILLIRTIIIIGSIALLGFVTAICIHAKLKGQGNILEGIHRIIEDDVLRRTSASNLNMFDSEYYDGLNASVWEVYSRYFKLEDREIITGIKGNLFPTLCIVPLCIFVYEYVKREINIQNIAMYVVFFLTAISWFCLAKGHSLVHPGLNFVLWYFGFVQTCFYIIVSKVAAACSKR